MILRSGDKHELRSRSGKVLGRGSRGEMEKREGQVNYFKHLRSKGGKGRPVDGILPSQKKYYA